MEGKLFLGQNLIWVMILLMQQLHGYKSCILNERNALLELKKYIISTTEEAQSDSIFSTWTNDTTADCCQWERVKCNRTSGRIIELSIDGLNCKESSLLNLSLLHPFDEIQSLNISRSRLGGFYGGEEGYQSLRRLRNLEILDLSFNQFNNSIFPFLNAATSLTTLFLKLSNMDGPFPAKEIKDLTNLKLLDLSENRFNGSIPIQEIKDLTNLELLDLSYNLFNGFIPIQDHHILNRLRNLKYLDLSWNKFSNSIFPTLNAATSLTTLFLQNNNMEGPFPIHELRNLTNLEVLDLSKNRFNGSIPVQELFSMGKLKALDLSDNYFSGLMELQLQGICKLKNMQELDLSRNKLVGQFPSCLTRLTGLRVLVLSSNQLTGKLPSALGNLESLEYLLLSENDFEGFFSLGWLTNLSKLKVFKLSSTSNSLQVVESESSWKPKFQLRVLALQSCNLGKVPRFLLHQKDLRLVDLSNNKISGTFPSWLLENNTKLEDLFLQKNAFTIFQLPESVHNLRTLNVSKNDFEGYMPSSMGNMKRLGYLDISHNRFQGKLPSSFVEGCYSLAILILSHNKLSGEIFPRSTISLQENNLLSVLAMDNNQFTGKIGQGLRSLRYLELLDISNNNLTGVIPSWIGELPSLNALLLSNNSLEGEIPISLFNESSPRLLDLSSNILSGDIPQHVNSKYPRALFLQDNNLSGVIPNTLLASVEIIDLSNNRLYGNIPEFINTQDIITLLLQGNNLTGRITRQLCGLRNIQQLNLSNNRLNGSIPSCLSNTSFGLGKEDTQYAYDYGHILSGSETFEPVDVGYLLKLDWFGMDYTTGIQIRIEFATKHRYDTYTGGNLKLLFGLDLSDNELSGEIPVELGGLLELQSLNLSHNKLSGVIPEIFSGLKNVESLDLSFNILRGRIPQELTELSSLAVFNVSYNNLSGIIPQGKQFNTFDTPSYLGNPLLCGKPTNKNCSSNNNGFQEPDDGVKDNDESRIDIISFYWSFGAAYVTILVGIFASLSFDSPWSRFWFYIVDAFIHKARNLFP